MLKVGDSVKISRNILQPEFNWGGVTYNSVGIIKIIEDSNLDVIIDFPEQIGWHGKLFELRRTHGTKSNTSIKSPKKHSSQNAKKLQILNPSKIIKDKKASSNEYMLENLFDDDKNTFWQSNSNDQTENQIWIELKMKKAR